MLKMWIKDLTLPDKPRVYMGNGGYASVQEMQDELIRRRSRIAGEEDGQFINLEAIDRILNGVIVWKFYCTAGCWRPIQQVTLET